MRYSTEFEILANPMDVFAALHHYKIKRDTTEFFPSRLVKLDFQVLTDQALGLGAVYDWKVRVFGLPVLTFAETVVEWSEGEVVAYQALSGWQMRFRTELQPLPHGTRLQTQVDYSFGYRWLNRIVAPLMNWGMNKIYRRIKTRLEASTRSM